MCGCVFVCVCLEKLPAVNLMAELNERKQLEIDAHLHNEFHLFAVFSEK